MRLLLLVSLLITAAAAVAQGKAGALAGVPYQLWRYTTAMTVPGMPPGMAMPGMRNQTEVCNSETTASRGSWDPSCKVTDLGSQGLTQRVRLECAEMSGDATTTWAADGRSFKSKFNAKMRNSPDAMVMDVEGVFVRPCTQAEAKR